MKKILVVLLLLAVLAGGIEIATLAEQKNGLQKALDEQTRALAKMETEWKTERQAAEEERLALLRKTQLTQMENDALHMENENLLARLAAETVPQAPVSAFSEGQAEKVQLD